MERTGQSYTTARRIEEGDNAEDEVDVIPEGSIPIYEKGKDEAVLLLEADRIIEVRKASGFVVPVHQEITEEAALAFRTEAQARGFQIMEVRVGAKKGLAARKSWPERLDPKTTLEPMTFADTPDEKLHLKADRVEVKGDLAVHGALETLPRYGDDETVSENKAWMDANPGRRVVTFTLDYNEHGVPFVEVTGPEIVTHSVLQAPDTYVDAIRKACADSEWAKNPRDDLGDLPSCPSEG